MDHAGGQGQPLLPAAGELARELFSPLGQPEPLDAFAARPRRRFGMPYMRATKSRFSAMVRSS